MIETIIGCIFSSGLRLQLKTLVANGFVAVFVLGLVFSPLVTTTSSADDFARLRLAWCSYLTGGTNLNLSDTNISNWVTGIGNSANSYWSSINKSSNRTYLWSNAAGWSSNSANITTSYERLSVMAQGWATKGSILYSNAALANDIISALDWMYTNVYNQKITQYDNWWDWEIGAPNDLNKSLVMMYPLLSGTQITNYCNAIDHFTPTSFGTGANRVWFSKVMAVRGIVGLSSNKVAMARDILSDVSNHGANDVFAYVTSGDGFYSDGSYIQHGNNPYNGGYGADLIEVVASMLVWLAPSPWAVTDPLQTNVVQWCYNNFQPLIYYGAIPGFVRGRGIAVSTGNDYGSGQGVINTIFRVAQTAPTNDAAKLDSMVKYWGTVNPNAPLISYMSIDLIPAAEQLLTNASVVPQGELIGHYCFPGMDRVMHLRPGFGFGLSLFSSRIANYEYINLQNAHGWFTGYGMTYLFTTNDWFQYTDNYWPTVDPYHLPGTTANQTTLSNGVNADQVSSQNWVGGASLSGASGVTAGVAGMSLADVGSSLVAKKSWFMFNDEIVCLGAGITGGSTNVHTTVENRKISAANTNTFMVDGNTMPATLSSLWLNLPNVKWCALDISGGYYFPGGASIKILRSTRTGAWSDINPTDSKTTYSRNYLTIILDHGIKPTNATYAYVMLPNYTAAAVSNYAANPTAFILTNSPTIQAVSEPALGILAANFWTAGGQTVGMLTASNQCSVITRATGNLLEVDVSDPTWTNTKSINLALNSPCISLISADPGVSVSQLSPTVKLSVNVNGARGKTFQVRLQRSESPRVTLTNTDAYGNTSFNVAGNWSDGQSPGVGKDYSTTPFWTSRSPPSASNFTFAGNSLTLNGSGVFDDHLSLTSKQTDSKAVLTFNNLIFTNLAVFENVGTGGPDIGLAGNIIITNGGGALAPADGDIIVSGAVSGSGPLWIGAATTCAHGVIFSGSISNFNGSIYATNLATQAHVNTAMVTFSNSVDQIYSGDLVLMYSDTFTNAVTKAGSGVLTLTGNNTYAGITTVSKGTLLVNGSIASSPVFVGSGATLGGTGTVGGAVTINAGGTLAPGIGGIGTLSVANSLTLGGNLVVEVNKSIPPSNNFCFVSGVLTNAGSGTLTIGNFGPALVAGDTFRFFNKPMLNGGALTVVPSPGAGLVWTNKLAMDGSIAVLATTASNPTNINFSVNGNSLNLSWPADHLGWIVQSNGIGLSNTNGWFDIPGSQNGTNLVITPNSATTNVFYRLRHP